MNASTITPEIAAFAAAVRAALSDLPADERDDLTEGLEADLAEAYAEDLRRELPDPAEYATELRNAAGLPAPVSGRRGFAEAWRGTARDLRAVIHRHPALDATVDFLRTLRPAWWVARGWAAAWLLAAVFGGGWGFLPSFPWFLVAIAMIVGSVQLGRGAWRFHWLTPLVVVGNVVAAITLVALLDDASNGGYDSYSVGYEDAMSEVGYSDGGNSQLGLSMGGRAVQNVYAYDAQGNALTGVQLFDQDGRPLDLHFDPLTDECFDPDCKTGVRTDENGNRTTFQPTLLATGREALNVFPFSFLPIAWSEEDMENLPTGPAVVPPAPFDKVPAVGKVVPAEAGKVAPNND